MIDYKTELFYCNWEKGKNSVNRTDGDVQMWNLRINEIEIFHVNESCKT